MDKPQDTYPDDTLRTENIQLYLKAAGVAHNYHADEVYPLPRTSDDQQAHYLALAAIIQQQEAEAAKVWHEHIDPGGAMW
jgi:hypothetical protein